MDSRIEDGARRTGTFPRIFHPGNIQLNASTVRTDSCYASVDDVGICKREPCLGRNTAFMVPAQFSAGQNAFPISAFWTDAPLHSLLPLKTRPVAVSESAATARQAS